MTVLDALTTAAPGLVAAALVFGPATSWLAARRQRNPAIWLVFGALIGPLALLLVHLAPPARCPACGEATGGFVGTCVSCGADLRSHKSPARNVPDDLAVASPIESITPGINAARMAPARLAGVSPVAVGPGRDNQRRRDGLDLLPDRLAAVGAHRPGSAGADPGAMARATHHVAGRLDLTMIALGVFVRGSEKLTAGSRYLVARTNDQLIVVGPLEPAQDHLELDLPLAGLEADQVGDRLVISGFHAGRGERRFVLAFQGVTLLATRGLDDLLTERREAVIGAVRSS